MTTSDNNKRRKQISLACTECRRSKTKCDAGRPCKRCLTRGTVCTNAPAKKKPQLKFPRQERTKRNFPKKQTSEPLYPRKIAQKDILYPPTCVTVSQAPIDTPSLNVSVLEPLPFSASIENFISDLVQEEEALHDISSCEWANDIPMVNEPIEFDLFAAPTRTERITLPPLQKSTENLHKYAPIRIESMERLLLHRQESSERISIFA